MGIKRRVLGTITTVACACLLAQACSGDSGQPLDPAQPATPAGSSATIDVLGESVAVPAGVDPALMCELAEALKQAVSTNEGSTRYPPSDWFPVAVDTSGAEPKLSWEYTLPGDYDQNGKVEAQDIVPLAQGFGLRSAAPAFSDYRTLDGDANGEINAGDITPIGRYYGAKLIHPSFYIYMFDEAGIFSYYTYYDLEIPAQPDFSHPWQLAMACPLEYKARQFYGHLTDTILGPPEPLHPRASYGEFADHIEISWLNPIAGASEYLIYRDDPATLYVVYSAERPYKDYDIEYGREYTYWVQASSWIFKSKLSEPAVGMALDWQSHDIDDSARSGYYPSACIVDGKPAVSYANPRWHELRYTSSLDQAPRSMEDWQLHEATDVKDQTGVISYLVAFKGLPCIGYTSDVNTWHSRLAVAKSSNPDSQESWEHADICEPGQRTALADLAVVNGKLAACYIHYPLEDVSYRRLIYARALIDWPQDSTDWNATVVAAGYGTGVAPHLASYQGQPVMLYHEEINENTFRIVYARAQTSEPAGEEDWLQTEVDTIGYDFYQTDLEFVEDCPAVFYEDGYDEQDAHIWQYTYAKASSFNPQGPEDWHRTFLALPYHAYETTDLSVVDDKPAVVFTSFNQVLLAWAAVPNPMYPRDWNVCEAAELPVVGNPLLYFQFSLADLDGLPIITYREDRGDNGSRLRCISPVWP